MVEDGISLVSLPDLAAMKLSAIANRGARKDFIDIAALLEEYSLKELLGFHEKKFPQTDLLTVVKSLTWFDEAEAEPDPKFLHQQTWESVKSTILGAVVEEATK
jgi:predicted nucleotidyltransferase component of viral defense system